MNVIYQVNEFKKFIINNINLALSEINKLITYNNFIEDFNEKYYEKIIEISKEYNYRKIEECESCFKLHKNFNNLYRIYNCSDCLNKNFCCNLIICKDKCEFICHGCNIG